MPESQALSFVFSRCSSSIFRHNATACCSSAPWCGGGLPPPATTGGGESFAFGLTAEPKGVRKSFASTYDPGVTRPTGGSMIEDNPLIHVRFSPDGSVTEIGELPGGTGAQEWFDRLIARVGNGYQPLSGGRAVFRIPRAEIDALKAAIETKQ
jgi:hypothetical protein